MKTTTNNINFPGTAKLFAFAVLISGLAFLSCLVTDAQVSNTTNITYFIDEVNDSYADVLKSSADYNGINMDQVWAARFERAIVPGTESRLEVEEWMLNAEYTTNSYEETLKVEDWMLDSEYTFEVYEETPEIEDWMLDAEYTFEAYEETPEIEDWMLDLDYFYTAEVYEETLELEDWMLDTRYFLDAVDSEDPVELEDWMLY